MPKFELGRIVATPGALRAIHSSGQSPNDFLCRHINGDWGEHLDGHDLKQNMIALREGGRLLSGYQTRAGDEIRMMATSTRASSPHLAYRYEAVSNVFASIKLGTLFKHLYVFCVEHFTRAA